MSEQATEQTGDEGGQERQSQERPAEQQQPQGQQQTSEWDGKVESLPTGAQAMIRQLRGENASTRTNAEQRQQEMARALAKAAGIELPGEDQKVDADALAQQLTASQTAQRDSAVQLAVYRAAGKQSLDPDALLDSRRFLGTVSDLDPTAADFADKVQAAVKVEADAGRFRAGRAPGASAADAPGGRPQRTTTDGKPLSLHEAVAQHYNA